MFPSSDDWVEPSRLEAVANGTSPSAVLGAEHVASWRERGFAFVERFLPSALLEAARDDALAFFPTPGSDAAQDISQFGSAQRFVFPSASRAANDITLHPRLLGAVAELLGVAPDALRLTQSDLWPKYGRAPSGRKNDNADQRIHVDYPNHTLTHPPRWDTPEAVEIILYLSDVDECGGATAVVPREGPDDPAYPWPVVRTPGVSGFDYVNDRAAAETYLAEEAPEIATWRAEHLYARERKVRYRFGSVLFYRHDTWHRGTPMIEGALRLVHNFTFRRAASEWIGVIHPSWAWSMYRPERIMERLIATSSVTQRCVLGFPPPGHPYWNADTIRAVAERYREFDMDMSPYEAAL